MNAPDPEQHSAHRHSDEALAGKAAIFRNGRFLAGWLIFAMTIAFAGFSLWGVRRIPFHPDESTYLYMSADFETLLHDPLSLAMNPDLQNDRRQRYRGLDAPLTRYILGASRTVAGLRALPADWDWSQTWEANRQTGALPEDRLLMVGRLGMILALSFSLVFIFLCGKALGGELTGVLAALLLGSNALILLHGRRAMAEGILASGVTLALWGILQADKRPWLAGLCIGLAVNAKQSTLALLPVGLLAAGWPAVETTGGKKSLVYRLAQFAGVFALLCLALNPFYWRHPIQAMQAAWQDRQELVRKQAADIARLSPEKVLNTPGQRVAVMLANLYITPPAFAEVGNYASDTARAEREYLAIPGHNLWRGILGGGFLLFLTLFGMTSAGLEGRRTPDSKRRAIILMFLATGMQVLTQIFIVPLYWQRYVIPLVPLACLWSAYGASALARIALRKTR